MALVLLRPNRPGTEAERIAIPIDRAVPAGLIVNELVTNAFKYAFGNSGGRIRIHFGMTSNRSEAVVSVEDDGKAMPKPPNKGLGLRLVEGFAQQIQGSATTRPSRTAAR